MKCLSYSNATVAYGPFKGLKFSSDAWWGRERASMILGLYEQEVLESLTNIPKKYKSFIDLGAADGYYGIGVLVNNLFENSICFGNYPLPFFRAQILRNYPQF